MFTEIGIAKETFELEKKYSGRKLKNKILQKEKLHFYKLKEI